LFFLIVIGLDFHVYYQNYGLTPSSDYFRETQCVASCKFAPDFNGKRLLRYGFIDLCVYYCNNYPKEKLFYDNNFRAVSKIFSTPHSPLNYENCSGLKPSAEEPCIKLIEILTIQCLGNKKPSIQITTDDVAKCCGVFDIPQQTLVQYTNVFILLFFLYGFLIDRKSFKDKLYWMYTYLEYTYWVFFTTYEPFNLIYFIIFTFRTPFIIMPIVHFAMFYFSYSISTVNMLVLKLTIVSVIQLFGYKNLMRIWKPVPSIYKVANRLKLLPRPSSVDFDINCNMDTRTEIIEFIKRTPTKDLTQINKLMVQFLNCNAVDTIRVTDHLKVCSQIRFTDYEPNLSIMQNVMKTLAILPWRMLSTQGLYAKYIFMYFAIKAALQEKKTFTETFSFDINESSRNNNKAPKAKLKQGLKTTVRAYSHNRNAAAKYITEEVQYAKDLTKYFQAGDISEEDYYRRMAKIGFDGDEIENYSVCFSNGSMQLIYDLENDVIDRRLYEDRLAKERYIVTKVLQTKTEEQFNQELIDNGYEFMTTDEFTDRVNELDDEHYEEMQRQNEEADAEEWYFRRHPEERDETAQRWAQERFGYDPYNVLRNESTLGSDTVRHMKLARIQECLNWYQKNMPNQVKEYSVKEFNTIYINTRDLPLLVDFEIDKIVYDSTMENLPTRLTPFQALVVAHWNHGIYPLFCSKGIFSDLFKRSFTFSKVAPQKGTALMFLEKENIQSETTPETPKATPTPVREESKLDPKYVEWLQTSKSSHTPENQKKYYASQRVETKNKRICPNCNIRKVNVVRGYSLCTPCFTSKRTSAKKQDDKKEEAKITMCANCNIRKPIPGHLICTPCFNNQKTSVKKQDDIKDEAKIPGTLVISTGTTGYRYGVILATTEAEASKIPLSEAASRPSFIAHYFKIKVGTDIYIVTSRHVLQSLKGIEDITFKGASVSNGVKANQIKFFQYGDGNQDIVIIELEGKQLSLIGSVPALSIGKLDTTQQIWINRLDKNLKGNCVSVGSKTTALGNRAMSDYSSEEGSSGSPIFNANGQVIGVHKGSTGNLNQFEILQVDANIGPQLDF